MEYVVAGDSPFNVTWGSRVVTFCSPDRPFGA
ncbi:hypothetical protein MFUL124B02_14495 [Myxococcus fulvus 124B02]|nr:hypothetical protein MFUL124B02_14495 [Myxococcus fulvus 124B02]